MRHKPSKVGDWRVVVIDRTPNEWEPRWVWRRAVGVGPIRPLPLLYHFLVFFSMRDGVRRGSVVAVRLLTPDGTVAAEEYARSIVAGEPLKNYPIRWPKRWRVRGGKRFGSQ